jgi:transposase
VLFVDECHLMSGDLQGYVWGRTGERVEVPIVNERERQTYYGALDLLSQRLLVQAHAKGNTTGTIEYLKFLQTQWPEQRLLILWDGASYHRSKELQAFLSQVNDGLNSEDWNIHCVRFAPNDPSQNPIEDAWLQAKTWLRRMSGLRPCFTALKALFEQFFRLEVFDFPKMHQYGSFS